MHCRWFFIKIGILCRDTVVFNCQLNDDTARWIPGARRPKWNFQCISTGFRWWNCVSIHSKIYGRLRIRSFSLGKTVQFDHIFRRGESKPRNFLRWPTHACAQTDTFPEHINRILKPKTNAVSRTKAMTRKMSSRYRHSLQTNYGILNFQQPSSIFL